MAILLHNGKCKNMEYKRWIMGSNSAKFHWSLYSWHCWRSEWCEKFQLLLRDLCMYLSEEAISSFLSQNCPSTLVSPPSTSFPSSPYSKYSEQDHYPIQNMNIWRHRSGSNKKFVLPISDFIMRLPRAIWSNPNDCWTAWNRASCDWKSNSWMHQRK